MGARPNRNRRSAPAIHALIRDASAGEGPAAARETGLDWTATGSMSAFLTGLERSRPRLVLVSLDSAGVDAALAERIVGTVREWGGRVLLSAPRASLDWAVLARKLGGGGLLREPLEAAELGPALRGFVEEPDGIEVPPSPATGDGPGLVGSGKVMMGIVRAIAELGDSNATVLITGESGTGKELVARAVHWASPRRDAPFLAINCAAIPEALLESEFFGHEKGAFTGAVATRKGRFERADGGSLFLDEVGDMSVVLQAKLLRALEEREIERVGGDTPIPTDVRVVAATNQRLETRVQERAFREDLYYRLAVARIHVPPLRERLEDLPELAVHFVARFGSEYGKAIRGVTDDALRLLSAHGWPGNIRELRNVLDRAVLNQQGGWIRPEDLQLGDDAPTFSPVDRGPPDAGYPPGLSLEAVERDHISRVLAFTGGALTDAARILGIHRNTLTRKVARYGLGPEEQT